EAAVEDSTRSLATARGVGDLQAMLPCLATQTFVSLAAGRVDLAREASAEWAALTEERPEFAFGGPAELADALGHGLGAERVCASLSATTGRRMLWPEAGIALLTGDFDRAIELYESADDVVDVALARLRAAEGLVQAGRQAEADAYLQPALAFFR